MSGPAVAGAGFCLPVGGKLRGKVVANLAIGFLLGRSAPIKKAPSADDARKTPTFSSAGNLSDGISTFLRQGVTGVAAVS